MNINMHNADLAHVAGIPSQHLKGGYPQFAFSGRSNVGKSSLINSLLMRKKLARVSCSPGKTITVNFYEIDGKLLLCDLPGYGYAKRSPEERQRLNSLGDGYFRLCNPKAVIQLIDLKAGVTADDAVMLDYLTQTGIPYYIAATKCDKLNKTDRAAALAALPRPECADGDAESRIIPFSSLNGEGRDALWKIISGCC